VISIPTISQSCVLCGGAANKLVCQTRDFCYETCGNEFSYVQCDDCGHVYLKNRPQTEALDVIYPRTYLTYDYDQHLGGFINGIRNRIQRMKLRPMQKYARQGDSIIDVGCGGGDFLALAKQFGDPSWQLFGVDFSDEALARLHARGLEGVKGRFEDMRWSGPPVGVIVMNQLIEHVEDPAAAVLKAFNILRPGGVLILETPNLDSWDARLFSKRYWGGWHAPRHWNLFNSETLSRCVLKVGFDLAEVSYILSPFSWLHSIQYGLRERLGWKRMAQWFDVDHFVPLCAASSLDLIQLAFTRRTANMRLIVQKPSIG